MIAHSVLIPHRDAVDSLAGQLPAVVKALSALRGEYEVLVIDDGSAAPALAQLRTVMSRLSGVRIVEIGQPLGCSAALSVGFAAARGETLIGMEAGGQYRPEQIPWLLDRLARADLVVGRRQRRRIKKTWLAVTQLPRRVLLGLDARDPDCLFWAVRREAVEGLVLDPGMHRFLAPLVSMRGYRVGEIYVDHQPVGQAGGREARPSAANLLGAWREARKWRLKLDQERSAAAKKTQQRSSRAA